MKKITLISLMFFISISVFSQIEKDSTLFKLTKTNYAIPDVPAYNMLGTTPSKVLRNSKVQTFSIITEFFNGQSFIIPKSFGVEFAPYRLMMKNKQTLYDYKKNYALNHTGISVGAYKDSTKTSKLSFGIRTTFFDNSDPLTHLAFDKSEFEKLDADGDEFDKAKDDFLKERKKTIVDLAQDSNLRKELDTFLLKNYASFNSKGIARYQNRLKNFQDTTWNKHRLDLAIGILGTSNDSLINNIQFNSFNTWLTYSLPLGRNIQSLNSLNYNLRNQTDLIHAAYLSSRLYIGSNQLKGFLEGQISYNSLYKEVGYLSNIGGEYNIFSSFWLEFSLGMHKNIETGERGVFNSTINVKYAFF